MNMKDLLTLNVLFIAYGSSYGLNQPVIDENGVPENFDLLAEGMAPEMKEKMKVASASALSKMRELSELESHKLGEFLQTLTESMSSEELEMIRIIFDNAQKKFKAA